MKFVSLLLSIFGLGALFSCKKTGYETKNGLVYFKDTAVREADPNSFETLNTVFGKDAKNAYYRGVVLEAEAGSFVALDEHYAKDKSTVFYCDNALNGQTYFTTRNNVIRKIAGADAASFERLEYNYSKDKSRCYSDGIAFPVQDVATFQPLKGDYAKDKRVGYFRLTSIPNSDGNSFEPLSGTFSKDRNHVFYSWVN
ncbi:DKNYY domain-containing protein [Larkinella terrae]|uniref:DKNYY family protein n=1 Tax=Larkinella terrae TaxID=2025311 RepID=A0A7K0EQN1_9BACT|nr:DKNYY domain-containing protein [Larkinella terrae]MRS63738.1 hypothetical protein [Larkinella terrae]